MNAVSFYRLECWKCSHTIELRAQDGDTDCPYCAIAHHLEWNGARAEMDERAKRKRSSFEICVVGN